MVCAEATVVETSTAATGEGRRRIAGFGTALRVAVSIAALVLVFDRVPLAQVAGAARGLDPAWTAAAFGFVFAAILLSAFKWQLLLKARNHRIGLPRLTRHYLVGLFFNNFLPTSVGGDVVRAWDVGRDLDDAPEGAASVIAERIIASLALGVTAAIGLPFVEAGSEALVAVAVVIGASLLLTGLFLSPSRSEAMMRSAMGLRFEGVTDWASRAVRGVNETLRAKGTVAAVLLLSIVFQMLVALVNYAIFRALGAPVGIGESIVYVSIISALTMVPVSISGHGVREAGYVYFFSMAGVPAAIAVTASLLFFLSVAISTLPGAVFFMAGRRR